MTGTPKQLHKNGLRACTHHHTHRSTRQGGTGATRQGSLKLLRLQHHQLWPSQAAPGGPDAARAATPRLLRRLPPTDTYNLCRSSAYLHGVEQPDNKKIATLLLLRSLLCSLARIYKHHDIPSDADQGIYQHKVLTGITMIQVLVGKERDQQTHPTKDVWASWDHRHRTIFEMGKSSCDGEVFRIVNPREKFTLQSRCNVELLDAYIREIQQPMCAEVPTLTRVIAGLHKIADSLGILEPGHVDFQGLAEDCNRQLYLLDHYHLRGVDIEKVSPQVRSYVQIKKTVPHCPALELLVTLEEV